ncbi:MAG: phenylalanine--tRNA ligase subunit alpha [Proteobacteria bacterium]|nr:phenylalanine--tRNA ligase subunit alpha [Pseudomonadota bacterium]MBU1688359.1 phenylalanine--tRNA ligase subunit alpha [Pseudomonadota bacterium]
MDNQIQQLKVEALSRLGEIGLPAELEEFRIKYLGRKGLFPALMKQVAQAVPADRPRLGQLANGVKREVETAYGDRLDTLTLHGEAVSRSTEDLTLPGRSIPLGRLHPVTQIMDEVCGIFEGLGFAVAEGPDVESDFYNFEALNIPPHHPARDMHDTFYVSDSVLLRTHTSPMQIRAMEEKQPPLRMIAPGKVYRCDSDVTHTPMFHQVEGFLVDRGISFADLKGVLSIFIARMFDSRTSIRFRPSFFPFTEPSAEVDIGCVFCGGKGCRVCKQTGWLEILGSGMIDPEVFNKVGYDPEIYSGFAFGLGIERIAMMKYGIDDIRLYYENDLRFLSQF